MDAHFRSGFQLYMMILHLPLQVILHFLQYDLAKYSSKCELPLYYFSHFICNVLSSFLFTVACNQCLCCPILSPTLSLIIEPYPIVLYKYLLCRSHFSFYLTNRQKVLLLVQNLYMDFLEMSSREYIIHHPKTSSHTAQ